MPALIQRNKTQIKKLHRYLNDPKIDIWSEDEVHFQQHGSRCRMWIASEIKDPILLHHPTRKSIGYFGAVCLRNGKLITKREDNSFNGQTFWDFLHILREESRAEGRKVVIIVDNARFHHARLHKQWRQEQEAEFVLDYLPPYSPQLNPIERIWKLTRRLCLHNRYFPTLNAVVDTVEKQFLDWRNPNEILRKLCAIT